jgi:alkanesulfonate monooxygenase SsuD/methylene tetrahydromethanopterin reductase-like flavin-dependent oxidoreductase (luciferase family)
MKFGIVQYLGTACVPSPELYPYHIVQQAKWAEKYGFERVLAGEHHALSEYMPDPFMIAMYLAAHTNKVKIGSYVALATLYHPVRLAEEIAMLDVFSNGRAYVALGIAYQPLDFEVFGIPIKQRVSRYEECIKILRAALRGEKISFKGKRYKVFNFELQPKPIQENLPIYLGAWTIPGARRAAMLGDGLALAPATKMSTFDVIVKTYMEEVKKQGKEPYIILCRDGWVSKDKESAAKEAGKYMLNTFVYYWSGGGILDLPPKFYKADGTPDLSKKDEITVEIMAEDRWIFGSVDDAISFIEYCKKKYDVKEIVMVFQQPDGNPPQKMVLDQIKLWGEKIIPYFKERE